MLAVFFVTQQEESRILGVRIGFKGTVAQGNFLPNCNAVINQSLKLWNCCTEELALFLLIWEEFQVLKRQKPKLGRK